MMQESSLWVAVQEFIHVGGALVVIIAAVSVLTGIMREYIPQDRLQKRLSKHERFGSFIGASFGILTPFCSASVVPVSMGMAEMGVSLGTIFGFLVSAPLCNFVVVGMILAVFGWKVAIAYFAITFSAAVLSGFLIARSPLRNEVKRDKELSQGKRAVPTCGNAGGRVAAAPCHGTEEYIAPEMLDEECDQGEAPEENLATQCQSGCGVLSAVSTTCAAPRTGSIGCCAPQVGVEPMRVRASVCAATAGACGGAAAAGVTHKEKLKGSMSFAWALFKRITPYVLVGAVISGISAAYLPGEIVEKYVGGDSWYAIPIAAGIGVPLYLRIEMAIPLLKVLIAKGMGMGAAMALVIGGTGASLPEIALISAVLKPKAVVAFVLTVFFTAIIGGIVLNLIA